MTADDFRDPDCVFQMGAEPLRVDIINDIDGVSFAQAWPKRSSATYAGVPVSVLLCDDYVANKRASGRASDLRDIATVLDDEGD